MLLRRVIEHVKAQNWTAVALDFVIVVVGVFIGIQVSNWNAARGDRAEYEQALARLSAEIDANIDSIDAITPNLERSLTRVRAAYDTLQSCTQSDANLAVVNTGLNELWGTYGFHIRHEALDELTSNPRLLAQQSEAIRKQLADLRFYVGVAKQDGLYYENQPVAQRVENLPNIKIGEVQEYSSEYFGFDYSKKFRPWLLNVSIDEACKDDVLLKAFTTWERWQSNIPVLNRHVRNELEETRRQLRKPRP